MRELREPGGLPALLRKVWSVVRITAASRLTYVGEVVVRSTFLVLILYIFTELWRATARSQDVLGLTGFSLPQLIWYLVFTESITLAAPDPFSPAVDQEVRSGDVAYRLSRPLAFPLYYLGADLGERAVRFTVNLAVGAVVALVVVGPVRLSAAGVAAALVAVVLGFLVDWVFGFTLSLIAFWMEDTRGLHLLYRRATQLLGGMMIPLDAYPDWLAKVARALPFRHLLYGPARLFVQKDAAGFGELCAALVVMGLVGLIPMLVVYRLGLRHVSAQGG